MTHPTDLEASELLIEETVLGIKIDVLCSGIFEGTVGADGADEITSLLALSEGAAISLTNPLACTNSSNCPEPLVVWVNLPYKTTLELMEEEELVSFADLVEGAGGPLATRWNAWEAALKIHVPVTLRSKPKMKEQMWTFSSMTRSTH